MIVGDGNSGIMEVVSVMGDMRDGNVGAVVSVVRGEGCIIWVVVDAGSVLKGDDSELLDRLSVLRSL